MALQTIKDFDQAQRVFEANITPRARNIMEYEAEVDGTRFDGRPDWFRSDEPIFDRKPCVIYRAVECSIQSKIDMLLGEGRFPRITASPEEDDDDSAENGDADDDGLNEKDSDRVDDFVEAMIREARLKALYRELYRSDQGCGTAVAFLGVRYGRLFAETLPAKHCTCTRDTNGELESVVVEYPYIDTIKEKGEWRAVCMLYRRRIDKNADITYKPAEANIDGIPPAWVVQTTVEHGLKFVPVIWHKYSAPMMHVSSEDGFPIHRTILPELEALHYALSQRHHGALNSLPQIVEIGVEANYNPTGVASSIHDRIQVTPTQGSPTAGKYYQANRATNRVGARKKGPNHVWQYENPEVKVESINTPGEALSALDAHIKDLRAKICEVLAWAPLDPEAIKFAATVSGRALEVLRERELNRVSYDRETFGEDVILGVIRMLLRIAVRFRGVLKTPKLKACTKILTRFYSDEGDWVDPLLRLKWPSYFLPSAEDKTQIVTHTTLALDKGIITKRTAVEALSWIFNINDVKEYMIGLEEEVEERRQQEMESEVELAKATSKFEYGGGDKPPPKKPKSPARVSGS